MGSGGCHETLDESVYNVLAKLKQQTGFIYWCCLSCNKSAAKLDKAVKELARRINGIEEELTSTNADVDSVKTELEAMKSDVNKMKDKEKDFQMDTKIEKIIY